MKIPEGAKQVFKGVIFSVYQWEQKMFDGSTEIFEMVKRPSTIEIIAVQGDKILMSKQSQPNKHNFFSLFGGRAEENEEPLVTAKRELLEESGLESTDWELVKSYQPVHKLDWEIYLFIARNCKKVAEPHLDPGEKIETVAYTFDEFMEVVQKDEYWGSELALDMLKMEKAGKLETFKRQLFVS
jgi:ADP-ribose pyrophosphatase